MRSAPAPTNCPPSCEAGRSGTAVAVGASRADVQLAHDLHAGATRVGGVLGLALPAHQVHLVPPGILAGTLLHDDGLRGGAWGHHAGAQLTAEHGHEPAKDLRGGSLPGGVVRPGRWRRGADAKDAPTGFTTPAKA